MDPAEEKKKLANEKRLKAIQEWRKKGSQQNTVKAVHHNFVSPVKIKEDGKNKLKLFDSDGEDDNNEHNFNIRPQFEGENGQHLLEMSSQFTDRFKLDERFREDDKEPEVKEKNEEKVKNIKILESILGYEVSEKYTEGRTQNTSFNSNKRYDPEDENASKYVKTSETSEERPQKKVQNKRKRCDSEDENVPENVKTSETSVGKPQKKIQKKNEISQEKDITKQVIPTSSERYIEVSSNLREILKSSSTSAFSLTAKFSSGDQIDDKITDDFNTPFSISEKVSQGEKVRQFSDRSHDISRRAKNVFESKRNFTFFILENDIRLKEGVEFFQRPKPMEEIRAEWDKVKEEVLDLFRRKRKTSQRGYANKPNASQRNKTFMKNKKV